MKREDTKATDKKLVVSKKTLKNLKVRTGVQTGQMSVPGTVTYQRTCTVVNNTSIAPC